MVAGLEEADRGHGPHRRAGGQRRRPQDRDVAMVFQSYALYPHLTVRKNIEFPLRHRGVAPRREMAGRVDEAAETLSLSRLLGRKPARALGRAAPAGGPGPGHRARARWSS